MKQPKRIKAKILVWKTITILEMTWTFWLPKKSLVQKSSLQMSHWIHFWTRLKLKNWFQNKIKSKMKYLQTVSDMMKQLHLAQRSMMAKEIEGWDSLEDALFHLQATRIVTLDLSIFCPYTFSPGIAKL